MKLKNRKGSTLALTLMVFAVLMIFATFILGFMVTENKQAMYFQNKTQAYYIARSGAEVVEAALVEQLSSYTDDAVEQGKFLNVYLNPKYINVDIDQDIFGDIDDVNNVAVKYEPINGKNVLTILSSAQYRGIEQTVKKVLYSKVTEIAADNGGITISNAPLMYIVSAKQHTNKGISDIPEEFAQKADANVFKPHNFKIISNTEWSTPNSIVIDAKISGKPNKLIIGNINTITDIYVDGPLTIEGEVEFIGKVNIYVKEHLTLADNTKILSESIINDGKKEFLLNIHSYNVNNNEYVLITPPKLHLTFKGNLFLKQGKVNIDFHQDAFIEGNIIYNGDEFHIGTQSNNISNLKKILEGSIYAPDSDIFIGFENDKTAFVLDGMILGKNLKVSAKNNSQINKFYDAFKTSGTITIPVDTGITNTTRTVGYLSYYTD